MATLLIVVLSGLSLFLLWRYLTLRKTMRELADAAELRKPFLVEKESTINRVFEIYRLRNAINALIRDNRLATEAEAGHLKQIEATLGNIQEAVIIVDQDNRIVLVNKALRGLLSYEGAVIGQRLENVLQSASLLDYVKESRRGEPLPNREIELVRGKESLWFEVTSAIMPEEDASHRELRLFVLHEITRQKKLERVRSEFVANVSHELRTPVTIIKGFTDTLADEHENLPPEARTRFLDRIQKNVIRLQRLLEDLLALTRLESAGETLHLSKVSLDEIAREAAENMRSRIEGQGLRVEVATNTVGKYVSIDQIKIQQVLENFFENAMRHAKGASYLRILTRENGDELECLVEDDGCGIPIADQAHVFERFYRVDKGRSRDSGGTGLGLSIVKHIVQIHRGTLVLESRVGEGTVIGFRLPIADPDSTEERVLERTSSRP